MITYVNEQLRIKVLISAFGKIKKTTFSDRGINMFKKTMSVLVVLAASSNFFAMQCNAFQSNGFKAEAVGLQVFKPKDDQAVNSMVMGQSPGSTVIVRITTDSHHIIGFGNRDTVKMTMTDNKNKKLSEFRDTQAKQFLFDVGEDGKSAVIPVSGSQIPSSDATKLNVKGTIEIITGNSETTTESTFKLEKGAKTKLGNIPCVLKGVAEAFDPSYKTRLEFETKQPFDAVSKVEFFELDGTEIESRYSGGGSFGFGDNYTYSRNYSINSDSKQVKVKVSYFADTETIEVPIELTTGLGF